MALVKLNNGKNLANNYSSFGDLLDTLFKDNYVDKSILSKTPAVNISETDKGYEIELAVPGLKKEQFKLNVEENILKVSADVQSEKTEENKKVTTKEFSFKSFSRAFNLPETADIEKINAKYEDGILYILIAKKEENKIQSREITIN